MDTKFLFMIGLMILILSTCSIDSAPAESRIERQAMIGHVCPIVQEGDGCPDQHHQVSLMANSLNGGMIKRFEADENAPFKDSFVLGK